MKLTFVVLATALSFAPCALLAQNIGERQADQQQRIAQGVRSGQLTARETARLEHQEAGIQREKSGMRAADNGHLTRADRRILTNQQNVESRRIFRDKHNARMR